MKNSVFTYFLSNFALNNQKRAQPYDCQALFFRAKMLHTLHATSPKGN